MSSTINRVNENSSSVNKAGHYVLLESHAKDTLSPAVDWLGMAIGFPLIF